jgi:hypothetical protein
MQLVLHSMHYCISNTSSLFQPNAHVILNTYFIKSLLHVSVCYTPSSGRTSYYLLRIICCFQCCSVCCIGYVIKHKIQNIFIDLQVFGKD